MTLHIALDGIYVNVNHMIIQKLAEYLTQNSYTVKTIFPLQDETMQSIAMIWQFLKKHYYQHLIEASPTTIKTLAIMILLFGKLA